MNIAMLLSQRNGKKFALAFLFSAILDNFRYGCIIFISARGFAAIYGSLYRHAENGRDPM